jgi:hypothetical protein
MSPRYILLINVLLPERGQVGLDPPRSRGEDHGGCGRARHDQEEILQRHNISQDRRKGNQVSVGSSRFVCSELNVMTIMRTLVITPNEIVYISLNQV